MPGFGELAPHAGGRFSWTPYEALPIMIVRIALCLSIIVAGLALRGFGSRVGLPAFIVKYGGSLLWGTMVFFLVAIALSSRSQRTIALVALAIAVCVELFRLVRTPWLDAFRLTTAGALLLGRIFSPWNMVAYAAGILFGTALDQVELRSR
jgi:hypothetical protein